MVFFEVRDQLHLLFFVLLGIGVTAITAFSILRLEVLFKTILFLAPISFSIDLIGGVSLKTPLEVLTIILVFVFMVKRAMGMSVPKLNWRQPIIFLIFAELIWLLLSSLNSELLSVSLKRTAIKVLFVFGFFVMFGVLKKDKKEQLFSLFGFGLIVPIVLIAIMHARYGFSQETSFSIAKPFFDDHTQYAAIVAFVMPYFLLNLKKESGELNILYLMISILFLFAVLTSYSRGAWISLIVALGFYLLLRIRVKFLVLMGIVLTGLVVLSINFTAIYDGLKKNEVKYADDVSQHLTSVTNLQNDASNLERVNRWVCAYRMFEAKPITGYGPGTYQFYYDLHQTPEYMTRISTHEGDKGNAHSEFFNALSEQGLMGGVINLLIMVYMVFLGMKVYYNQKEEKDKKLILAAVLGLVTFYIHGLFNTFSDIAEMALLIYGSLAIIAFHTKSCDLESKQETL